MQSIAFAIREHAKTVRGVIVAQDMRNAAMKIDKLEAALVRIRDGSNECACDHDSADCCVNQQDYCCPFCIAAVALK